MGRHYTPDGKILSHYLATNPYGRAPAEFHRSLVGIQGPVRSGKSVASAMRLYDAMMGVPHTEGRRRSRWLVTRNSYPDLEESTIKTWLEWFPEAVYGRFMWTPPYTHHMRFGDVEADVVFEAFKGEDDIPSLKSREYTGVWVNEGQFYTRKFVVALYERTGWFPIPGGPKWLQMDMNAPPLGHWVPMMRGDAPIPEEMTENERRSLIKPDDWEFMVQPAWFIERLDQQGGVLEYQINPEAENLRIVGEKAVLELLSGRTKDEIDADLMNRVMIPRAGLPVFPMFTRETHVAKKPLEPLEGVTIDIGLDFGRTPAMVAAQNVGGRWAVLDELTSTNTAAVDFAPTVKRRLATKFPGFQFRFWGDPSGAYKRENDNRSAFDIFEANGIHVRAADRGNRRTIRIETATAIFNRLVNGQPACLVSPTCPTVINGLAGGYVYRRKQVSGSPVYEEEPDKASPFSHPIDALLEIFMGAGESRVVLGRGERRGVTWTVPRTDPFGRPLRQAAGGRR